MSFDDMVAYFGQHTTSNHRQQNSNPTRDLARYLQGRLIRTKEKSGQTYYEIKCINNPDHNQGEAAVWELPDGKLCSSCKHQSCKGKHTWQHVKDVIGKPSWETPSSKKRMHKASSESSAEKLDATYIDPGQHAEQFISENSLESLPLVRRWRGAYYRRSNGRYVEVTDEDVKSSVVLSIKKNCSNVTTKVASDTLLNIMAETALSSTREPHNWITDHPGNKFDPDELICTPNRILHLPSLLDPAYTGIPETPAFFNLNATNFYFVPRQETNEPANWLEFLDQVFMPDEQRALKQWAGLCLTQKTNQQKMLMLIGAKRSGKGTVARVLSGLIGRGNVAGPTLASFSQNFGLQSLIGKQLAIVADARVSGKGASTIVERLLSISGEDQLTIDRKYREPWIGILKTRLMILSNELPRLSDASGALASRMIVLTTRQSFYGREDLTLDEKLKAEMPAIFWWAVDGYGELHDDGRLLVPAASTEQLTELERLASPEKAFLDDLFEVTQNNDDWFSKSDVYSEYKDWCNSEGIGFVPTLSVFARNLIAASGQRIKTGKRTDKLGQRFSVFKGLAHVS